MPKFTFFYTYKHWILSILAGLLLAMPWLYQSLGFIILIAFVPLLIIIFNNDFTLKKAFGLIITSCLLWFVLATSWLLNLKFSTPDFILLTPFILLYSIILSGPLILAKYISTKYSTIWGLSILPISWWLMEWGNAEWDLSNTWVNLHYALCEFPSWLGFIYYLGFRSTSFIIILINIGLYLCFFSNKVVINLKKQFQLLILAISLGVLGLNVIFQLKDFQLNKTAKIAIIQPNFDPYEVVDDKGSKLRYTKLITMTIAAASQKPDLICWHETALRGPQIEVNHITTDTTIIKLNTLSKQINTPIILGTFLFKIHDYRPKNFTAAPTGDGRYYDVTNSAILVQPNGGVDYYNKMKLVPFIERLPFIKFLAGTPRSVFALGEQYPSYEKGKKRNLLMTEKLNILPVICNESIYPDHIKKFNIKKANVIIVMSNDGWAGNSRLCDLHAGYAKILAIENNKYVIRATNNGISMIISPKGKIEKSSKFNSSTTLTGTIKY